MQNTIPAKWLCPHASSAQGCPCAPLTGTTACGTSLCEILLNFLWLEPHIIMNCAAFYEWPRWAPEAGRHLPPVGGGSAHQGPSQSNQHEASRRWRPVPFLRKKHSMPSPDEGSPCVPHCWHAGHRETPVYIEWSIKWRKRREILFGGRSEIFTELHRRWFYDYKFLRQDRGIWSTEDPPG